MKDNQTTTAIKPEPIPLSDEPDMEVKIKEYLVF